MVAACQAGSEMLWVGAVKLPRNRDGISVLTLIALRAHVVCTSMDFPPAPFTGCFGQPDFLSLPLAIVEK